MDEGLGFALIPIFVIALPIVMSSLILYFILGNEKDSIIGLIIRYICTIIIVGIFWYFAEIFYAQFLILIVSGMIGLIVIKIFRKIDT